MASVFILIVFSISYFNRKLLSDFIEQGEYHCSNVMTRIFNIAIEEQMNDFLKDKVVETNFVEGELDFNVEILNSLTYNVVNRSYQILQMLERGNLGDEIVNEISGEVKRIDKSNIYSLPVGMIFNNPLIANLGVEIPVKYEVIGQIKGEIVSSIEEYGINNAMVKIVLDLKAKTKILVPMKIGERDISIKVPLVVKVIKGEIPDYYLGTHVVGGVGQ